MTTPPRQRPRRRPDGPARALAKARAALVWERTAALIWPAAIFPGLYVIAALAGLWNMLGDPWRAIALGFAALGTLIFTIRGAVARPWPRADDVQRRVEEDSALSGRPFEALEDHATSADPAARALWRAHQARMAASLKDARARRPRAALAQADRYALRGVLLLATAASAAAAGPQALSRLSDSVALEPLRGGGADARLDAWITPPEYTGQAPLFLTRGGALTAADGAITETPTGSELTVRVVGGARRPLLRVIGPDASQRMRLTPDGPDAFATTVTLEQDTALELRGAARADWQVFVTPDQPPSARFVSEPEAGARQELTLSFSVEDDYPGVSAALELARADSGELARFDLPPAHADGAAVNANLNLTQHPWAGLEVTGAIIAIDALGQEGASEPVSFTLPDRLFLNPLSQALAHERVTLMRDETPYAQPPASTVKTARDLANLPPFALDDSAERLDRAPAATRRVRQALDLLTLGDGAFSDDYALHALLALASERIARARDREELAGVEQLLWDAAVHAEGGELENARRELERARRALAEALARGDDQAEIDRRLQDFQQAVQRYMELLTAEALAEGRVNQGGGGAPGGMGDDALQDMLQALEDLSATGSRDDARRLLQALSEMLENMELQLSMGGGGGGSPPIENEELRQALEDLADLQSDQRDLGDDIEQQASGAEPSDQAGSPDENGQAAPGSEPGGLQDRQGGLSDQLDALMDALGDQAGGEGDAEERFGAALDELGDAAQAMERAERALGAGDLDGALQAHGEALEALRSAGTALSERELAERSGALDPEQAGAQDLDPFGQAGPDGGGFSTGEDTAVPDELQRQRAREILEELRRRLSEGERTEEEREYLRRLLEQF